MKYCRRHIAVLMLSGWYLMVPPAGCNRQPNLKAPLSQWVVIYASDDGDLCGMARKALKHPTADSVKPQSLLQDAGYEGPVSAVRDARCIATDDPRLAK